MRLYPFKSIHRLKYIQLANPLSIKIRVNLRSSLVKKLQRPPLYVSVYVSTPILKTEKIASTSPVLYLNLSRGKKIKFSKLFSKTYGKNYMQRGK